jgi:chromosome segregation ATPase
MNENQTIQALRLTIQDLSDSLTEALATKNLLSIQLAEAKQSITDLQGRVKELEAQLAELTEPAVEKGEE